MNGLAVKIWERMDEMARSSAIACLTLNQVVLRSMERMIQQQFDVVEDCLDISIRHLGDLRGANNGYVIAAAYAGLVAECGEKWTESARGVLDISVRTQAEWRQWIADNLQRADMDTDTRPSSSDESLLEAA